MPSMAQSNRKRAKPEKRPLTEHQKNVRVAAAIICCLLMLFVVGFLLLINWLYSPHRF